MAQPSLPLQSAVQPPPTHSTTQPWVPEHVMSDRAPTATLHSSVPEQMNVQLLPHSPAQPSVPEHVSRQSSAHTASQREPPLQVHSAASQVAQPAPVHIGGPPGVESPPQPAKRIGRKVARRRGRVSG